MEEDMVLLLVGLAERREKCRAVLGSPGLQRLVAVAHGNRPALRAATLLVLVKALVLVEAVQEVRWQCSAVYCARCGVR